MELLSASFWVDLGWLVGSVIVGYIAAWVLGRLVNFVMDRTIERKLDKTRVGEELRDIGLDFSDAVGLFTAVIVFLLFLKAGVAAVSLQNELWDTVVSLVNYSLVVVLGLGFMTVGLLFVTFVADYLGRLVKGYREDVGELLKLLLLVGLIWAVVTTGLEFMNLKYTIVADLMAGFIAFAAGWVLAEFMVERFKEYESFRDFLPYAKYVVLLIFILVGLNAAFSRYLGVEVIKVFAWGIVALFAVLAVPVLVRAIKEAF